MSSWSNQSKSQVGETVISEGSPIGLLLSLTYASAVINSIWTNQTKNTASWSNATKNSASWSNQTKN